MKDFTDILSFVYQNWMIVLPFGIVLLFLPKYASKLIFIILGFALGAFGVFPALLKIQNGSNYFLDLIKQNPNISMIVIGIIVAGIFAVLFRFAMFVLSTLIGFFAGKYLVEFILRFFPNLNLNFKLFGLDIIYIIAIAIGLAVGIYSLINFERIMKYLSIAIGSFLTTLVIFTLLSKINIVPNYPQNVERWVLATMIGVFVVLFSLGSVVAREKKPT